MTLKDWKRLQKATWAGCEKLLPVTHKLYPMTLPDWNVRNHRDKAEVEALLNPSPVRAHEI